MTAFTFPLNTPAWFVEEFSNGGTDPGEDSRDCTLVLATPEVNPELTASYWNLLSKPDDDGELTMVLEAFFYHDVSIEDILESAGPEAYYGIDVSYVLLEGADEAVAVPMIYLYNAALLLPIL